MKDFPDDVFAPDPKDPKYLADQKAAEEKTKRDQADYEKKLADGQKKVKDLAARFGPWYYVTPGESFNNINLDVNAVLRPKTPAGRRPRPRPADSPAAPSPAAHSAPACRPATRYRAGTRCDAPMKAS